MKGIIAAKQTKDEKGLKSTYIEGPKETLALEKS